jgi:hypothetical protein
MPMSLRRSLVLAALLAGPACAKKEAEKPAGLPPQPPGAAPTGAAAPAPAPAAPAPPSATPPADEAEAVPTAPDPKASVSGTITLPAARKKDVKKGDVLFIVARKAGGPPGPASMLAVQKMQAEDFPMKFTLSGRDAMIPGTPFEGEISITVRVDKDGDAMTRKKGDVFGTANNVKVGTQNAVVPLDTLQTEDKVLGGGAPMGGPPAGATGLPPGHP